MASHRLGWYVHYRKQNYKKYGLGYNENSKENMVTSNQLNGYKKQMIGQIQKNITESQLKDFEDLFNNFTYGMISQNYNDKLYQQAIEKMLELLNETMHTKYSQKSKLLNDVKSLQNLSQNDNLNKINENGNKVSIVEKFIKELDILYKEGQNMINHVNYTKIVQKKEEFNNCAKKLRALVDQYKKENSKIGNNFTIKYKNGSTGEVLRNVMIEARDLLKINTIPSENNVTGVIGEEFVNLLLKVGAENILNNQKLSLDEINKKIINQDFKSKNISIRVSGQDRSSPKNIQSRYAKKISAGNTGLFAEINSTQNKADVTIGFKGRNIGISVKNYGFYSNNKNQGKIGLVDGSPMMTMISNMNYTFINHWLNLKTVTKNAKGIVYKDLRDQADIVMKIGILSRAASGKVAGKTGIADIIAVNSRHGKEWRFLSIHSLIDNVIKNSSQLNKVAYFSNYPKSTIIQQWSGKRNIKNSAEALKRINKILTYLQGQKLSVSLKVANNETGKFTI